jgi:hypothetical protein
MAFSHPWHWPFTSSYLDEQESDDSEQSTAHQPDTVAVATSLAKRKSLATLLERYNNPGVTPPSARIDPLLNQEIRKPLRLLDLWKYGYFLASKSKTVPSQDCCIS